MAESPTPESCSSAGVWIAPAARMTSRLAVTTCLYEPPPIGANVTPAAVTAPLVEELAQLIWVTCAFRQYEKLRWEG